MKWEPTLGVRQAGWDVVRGVRLDALWLGWSTGMLSS